MTCPASNVLRCICRHTCPPPHGALALSSPLERAARPRCHQPGEPAEQSTALCWPALAHAGVCAPDLNQVVVGELLEEGDVGEAAGELLELALLPLRRRKPQDHRTPVRVLDRSVACAPRATRRHRPRDAPCTLSPQPSPRNPKPKPKPFPLPETSSHQGGSRRLHMLRSSSVLAQTSPACSQRGMREEPRAEEESVGQAVSR